MVCHILGFYLSDPLLETTRTENQRVNVSQLTPARSSHVASRRTFLHGFIRSVCTPHLPYPLCYSHLPSTPRKHIYTTRFCGDNRRVNTVPCVHSSLFCILIDRHETRLTFVALCAHQLDLQPAQTSSAVSRRRDSRNNTKRLSLSPRLILGVGRG